MSVYTVVVESLLIDFLENHDVGLLDSFESISLSIENTNYFVNTIKEGELYSLF